MSEQGSSTAGPGLRHDVRSDEDAAVVVLKGDVDLATTPAIESYITEVLATGDVHTFVLDLTSVEFLDSTGLRMLWTTRQMVQDAGARFVIRTPSDAVMRLLRLTGMHRIFQIETPD